MTEHAATFPYLSCMLLSPFVGLLILLCLKNEQKFLIRVSAKYKKRVRDS